MLNIDLKDKVAIVTGVSQGVGAGVATMLARAGCHVIGGSRADESSKGVAEFIASVEAESVTAKYVRTDVTSETDLQHLVNQAVSEFNRIDLLVSNAGVNIFTGAEECKNEDWEYNQNLNLKSHWQLAKLCKPYLDKSDNGVVLIMTSNHAYQTIKGCFPYNVTKTALTGLVRSLAIEWGPTIRVVGVAPGFVETAGNQKWFHSFPDADKERRRTIDNHPVGKLGTSEEIGALCAYLASDYAGFITGTTYLIDGGRSAILQDN